MHVKYLPINLYSSRQLWVLVSFILQFQGLQAQEVPTFLYRISGKGLTKPSYLMGSIHLQDARLFNFQHSMYAGIDRCEVFAIEVHPDSTVQRVMEESLKYNKRKLLKQQLSERGLAQLKKWIKTLKIT